MTDCYENEAGCVVVPAVAPVAATPARIDYAPNLGWNAGARSVLTLADNLHVIYDVPDVVGAVLCGFCDHGERTNYTPSAVRFGVLVFRSLGVQYWQPWEGREVGSPSALVTTGSTNIEIRRVSGRVQAIVTDDSDTYTYLFEGSLDSALNVMGLLYSYGDVIV